MFERRRRDGELEELLRTYLEYQIREAEDRAAAAEATKRRDAVRAEVGRMAFFLVLLVGYGFLLGAASQPQILAALLDPASLARDVHDAGAGVSAAVAAVPGALQAVLISSITAFALFVFRGTSTSVRSDLGGVLFIGGVVLALVGISAAALTGSVGVLMAVAGFVAAGVLVVRLCVTLVRLHEEATGGHAGWSGVQLERWSRRITPRRHWLMAVAFVALPAFCLFSVGGAALTHGGPLYGPAFASRFVAVGWSLWAVTVTPTAARIPLWSMVGWGTLVVLQLSQHPASYVFLLAAAALLAAPTVWLVLTTPSPAAPT